MENIFRVILPLVVLGFAAHRGYYVRKQGKEENTLKKREESWISKVAGVLGLVGFLAVMAYSVKPVWISWASLSFRMEVRWIGVVLALLGFALLQWAQNTLGKNWSDTPRMIREQALVTAGPYRYMRHPIYTAFLLIFGSTLLISANWLIGLAWIGMTSLEVASRIDFEEHLMLEYFGEQYREYMKKTGRYLPRWT